MSVIVDPPSLHIVLLLTTPPVSRWRGRKIDLMMSGEEKQRKFLPTVRKHMRRILMLRRGGEVRKLTNQVKESIILK